MIGAYKGHVVGEIAGNEYGATIINKYFSNGKIENIIAATKNSNKEYVLTQYLDMSNYNDIVESVSGWLTDNGYADVSSAIENNIENLTTLSSADYFGALEWKPLIN